MVEKKCKELLSSADVARQLGICNESARKMLISGRFGHPIQLASTGSRIHWRVKRVDFQAFLQRHDFGQLKMFDNS